MVYYLDTSTRGFLTRMGDRRSEPIAMGGFVMNTSQEIDVAFEDMPRTAWATSPHRAKKKNKTVSEDERLRLENGGCPMKMRTAPDPPGSNLGHISR